jgi:tetratricopeptide (TPR) repeat protein
MIAGATLALMALCTSQSEVAEAWRGASSRASVQTPAAQQASAALAPLPLVDETRLAPPAPVEPLVEPPVAEPAAVESAPVEAMIGAASNRAESPVRPAGSMPEARQRARALQKKGLSLYLHAQLDAAYGAYRQATLLAPSEAAAFRGLGLTAGRLGRGREALRALTRYLELAPNAPDARLIRARVAELISAEAARGLRGGQGERALPERT